MKQAFVQVHLNGPTEKRQENANQLIVLASIVAHRYAIPLHSLDDSLVGQLSTSICTVLHQEGITSTLGHWTIMDVGVDRLNGHRPLVLGGLSPCLWSSG